MKATYNTAFIYYSNIWTLACCVIQVVNHVCKCAFLWLVNIDFMCQNQWLLISLNIELSNNEEKL